MGLEGAGLGPKTNSNMRTKTIELTVEELDLAIIGLEMIYVRQLKKQEARGRSLKTVEDLRFTQKLTQKLMAARNYGEEEISNLTGCDARRGEDEAAVS